MYLHVECTHCVPVECMFTLQVHNAGMCACKMHPIIMYINMCVQALEEEWDEFLQVHIPASCTCKVLTLYRYTMRTLYRYTIFAVHLLTTTHALLYVPCSGG